MRKRCPSHIPLLLLHIVFISTFFTGIASGEAAAPSLPDTEFSLSLEDVIQSGSSVADEMKEAVESTAKELAPYVRKFGRSLREYTDSKQANPAPPPPLPWPPRGFIQDISSIISGQKGLRIRDIASGGVAFTGWVKDDDGNMNAVIWDRGKGWRTIPTPPGAEKMRGLRISSDGKTVLGLAVDTERVKPNDPWVNGVFVWREGERVIFSPTEEKRRESGIETYGMSADGRIIAFGRDRLPKLSAAYFYYPDTGSLYLVPTTGQHIGEDIYSDEYKYFLPPDMREDEPKNGLFQAISGDGETFVLGHRVVGPVYRINRTTMKRDVLGMKPFPGWDSPGPHIKSADIPGWKWSKTRLYPVDAGYINVKGVSHDGAYVVGTMDLNTAIGRGRIDSSSYEIPAIWDAEGNVEFLGLEIEFKPYHKKRFQVKGMTSDGNTVILSCEAGLYVWQRGQGCTPLEEYLKSYGLNPASVLSEGTPKSWRIEVYVVGRDGRSMVASFYGVPVIVCWGDNLELPAEYIEQKKPQ